MEGSLQDKGLLAGRRGEFLWGLPGLQDLLRSHLTIQRSPAPHTLTGLSDHRFLAFGQGKETKWGERAVLGTKVLSTCTQTSSSPCGTTATSLGLMFLPHWAPLLTPSAGLENILINLLLPDMDTCVPEVTKIQVPKPPDHLYLLWSPQWLL